MQAFFADIKSMVAPIPSQPIFPNLKGENQADLRVLKNGDRRGDRHNHNQSRQKKNHSASEEVEEESTQSPVGQNVDVVA